MIIFMVSFLRELYQVQNLKPWLIFSFLFSHVSFMIFKTGEYGEYYFLKKILQESCTCHSQIRSTLCSDGVFLLHMLYYPSPSSFFQYLYGHIFKYV